MLKSESQIPSRRHPRRRIMRILINRFRQDGAPDRSIPASIPDQRLHFPAGRLNIETSRSAITTPLDMTDGYQF
jgi:hypothetical protein